MNKLLPLFCLFPLWMISVLNPTYADEPSDHNCDGSTIDQSECLGKVFGESDRELNATFQSLIRLVRNHGEEWVNDLRAAQRKWIEFRDLNCKFYSNYLKGGTGAGLYSGACKVRMTRERWP